MNLSPDQQYAYDVLKGTRRHVAIFGGAGTGKSTLLREFRSVLELERRRYAIAAPTGVAALNISGMTLHKLLGLSIMPGPMYLKTGSRRAKFTSANGVCYLEDFTFIIDEISMVRPDVLDAIDMSLRADENGAPFGGARVVLIGDPLQLPPIIPRDDRLLVEHILRTYGGVSWFFASRAYRQLNPMPLLLEVSHRQHDLRFYQTLSMLRFGDTRDIGYLNYAARIDLQKSSVPRGIMIGTHRKQVARINERCLAMLPDEEEVFVATFKGAKPDALPVDERVPLKPGAQVICAANLYDNLFGEEGGTEEVPCFGEIDWNGAEPRTGLLAANGSRGTVVSTKPLRVQFEAGYILPIGDFVWTFFAYNSDVGAVVESGEMRQVPLMLGWAITSHKSQGMTLSEIEVDMRSMFDSGQSYVALSRVFSVQGLTLKHYLMPQHIQADPWAVNFMQVFHQSAQWARVNGWEDR